MSKKDLLWVFGSAGLALLALSLLTGSGPALFRPRHRGQPASWSQATISAGYIGSQLKEIDKTRASLIVSYDLENNTDADYRFDGPGVVILSRLKSDGSYSQEEPVRLAYPVFLPARQHARLAIEITEPFNWPSQEDSGYLDKMREFVKQRLVNVGGFVLFDEAIHWQVDLPSGWEQLQDESQASD